MDDTAASTLAEGRQVYIAVESAKGPHVTPELYTWSGDRLWFAAATSTLKARVLRGNTRAAAVVPGRARTVVLEGDVEVFDPRRPGDLARRAARLPEALKAGAGFSVRNAPDMLGFVRDTIDGSLGRRVPPARALFALDPDRVSGAPSAAVRPAGRAAVAAFPGPLALPAQWFEDERRLEVDPCALPLSGRFAVAVVVDEYNAPGPAAKQGTLVRGHGVLVGDGVIEVTPERTIDWDGVEVTSAGA